MQESRWTGNGHFIMEGTDVLFSGQQSRHIHGVALMVSRSLFQCLVKWTPVNERILFARFKTKFHSLSIIVCYAPTNDANIVDKEHFYDDLADVMNLIPRRDFTLILGDMNAKVGADPSVAPSVMGPHGFGVISDNGDRLTAWATQYELLVGGTIFPHKLIHQYTWTSPNQSTRNQIDHILFSKPHRHWVHDVRTKRGADAGSDHELLLAKIKLKLPRNKHNSSKLPFDVDLLNTRQKRTEFQIEVFNRFNLLSSVLQNLTSNEDTPQTQVDALNQKFVKVFQGASEKVLGRRKKTRPRWMSADTEALIAEKKEAKKTRDSATSLEDKQLYAAFYNDLQKRVKKAVRQDKVNALDKQIQIAENAVKRNDTKPLYKLTKQIANKVNTASSSIRDKNGNILTSVDKVRDRWKEHFHQIFFFFVDLTLK